MKNLIIVIFSFCGLFLGQYVFAQDAKKAFTKVNETFSKYDKISYNITYNYYQFTKDKKPYESLTGVFKKDGNRSYSKVGSSELLVNDKYRVIVDNESKHLVIENRPIVVSQQQLVVDLDSVLKECKSITVKKVGSEEIYSLTFDTGFFDYSKLDITVDASKNFITKIVFHLVETADGDLITNQPRLEIIISGYNTSPVFSKGFFSETNYVKIDDKGNVSLIKNFSSYTLLNNKVATQ